MPVEIPESYRAYCTDRAVQTAVDHILESKTLDVPTDLEWDELSKFHRAVLSAHQVRCEFAIFLHELWDEIWMPAVSKSKGKLTPKKIAKIQDYYWWPKKIFDTYSIWKEKWFLRVFDVSSTMYALEIGVQIRNENGIRLMLHICNMNNKKYIKYITYELDFGDCWSPEEYEDDRGDVHDYVCSKHVPIVDRGSIDLDPLRSAAAAALDAVERHCRPD